MHVESSKQHSDLRSSDIRKTLLYGFSPVKMDTFSYSSHQHWNKIGKNTKSRKFFPQFFHLWAKSLLFTLHCFIQVSVNKKKWRKITSFKSRSFCLRVLWYRYNIGNGFIWPQNMSQITFPLILSQIFTGLDCNLRRDTLLNLAHFSATFSWHVEQRFCVQRFIQYLWT